MTRHRTITAIVLFAIAAHAGAQAPPLDVALTCGRPGEVGGPRSGTDLFRIDVDPVAFPDAVCNDGTRAVFYVRRACPQTPGYRDWWHIHLEGGGACNTAQGCADRWCSVDTNFGAAQMSSRGLPWRIRKKGIFDPAAANAFRCWNHVYVHYCSSDTWRGEGDVALVTADDPLGVAGPIDYAIHLRGATIVDAVRDQLRQDCNGAACPASAFSADVDGDGVFDFAMPDLDDAEVVMLSGTSAGSGGVRFHADAFGAALAATNVNCLAGQPCDNTCVLGGCGLYYRAVVDAGLLPEAEGEDFLPSCTASGLCDTCVLAGACSYQDYLEGVRDVSIHALAPRRDEDSCVAWHALHDPAGAVESWRCEDPAHLALHHVTTPFFVRTDRQDSLLMKNFVTAGFGTCQEFGDGVATVARSLFDPVCPLSCSAEEAAAMSPLGTVGVFVPEHQEHVALELRGAFMGVQVEAPLGSGWFHTFHDTLFAWFFQTGAGLQQVVTEGSPVPPALPAWCPP